MIEVDETITKIVKRRKFVSFWEAFDYLRLANYEEVEAIMISSKLFDGKLWDKVIFAKDITEDINENGIVFSGNTNIQVGLYIINGDEHYDTEALKIEVFIMTSEAEEIFLPIYEAYAETRDYAPNETLEKCVKKLTLQLTTELGIKLFTNWYNK